MKVHQSGMFLMWLDHTMKVWELLPDQNVTGHGIKLSFKSNLSVCARHSRNNGYMYEWTWAFKKPNNV